MLTTHYCELCIFFLSAYLDGLIASKTTPKYSATSVLGNENNFILIYVIVRFEKYKTIKPSVVQFASHEILISDWNKGVLTTYISFSLMHPKKAEHEKETEVEE
jgi:hypothetical protein